MELGTFSVSLTVKDLNASQSFYEKLGFSKIGGDGEHYLILKNSSTVLGLFQGMFERNILTFNPGWKGPQEALDQFTDVREIETQLKAAGVEIAESTTAKQSDGPAHITLLDPDGNPILIDQHV